MLAAASPLEGLALCFVACAEKTDNTKSDTTNNTTSQTKSQAITAAAGGELTTDDGMKLTIPAGALAADTTITVQVTTQAIDGLDVQSKVYVFGPAGLTFANPVAVSIPSTAGDGYVVYWTTLADPTKFEPIATDSGAGAKIGGVCQAGACAMGTTLSVNPTATPTATPTVTATPSATPNSKCDRNANTALQTLIARAVGPAPRFPRRWAPAATFGDDTVTCVGGTLGNLRRRSGPSPRCVRGRHLRNPAPDLSACAL